MPKGGSIEEEPSTQLSSINSYNDFGTFNRASDPTHGLKDLFGENGYKNEFFLKDSFLIYLISYVIFDF